MGDRGRESPFPARGGDFSRPDDSRAWVGDFAARKREGIGSAKGEDPAIEHRPAFESAPPARVDGGGRAPHCFESQCANPTATMGIKTIPMTSSSNRQRRSDLAIFSLHA